MKGLLQEKQDNDLLRTNWLAFEITSRLSLKRLIQFTLSKNLICGKMEFFPLSSAKEENTGLATSFNFIIPILTNSNIKEIIIK